MHHKRNPIYITFNCGQNKIKFCFGDGPKKPANSAKTSHSCFDEINAYADVSFHLISFRLVFTWQLSLRNGISVKMIAEK